MEEKESNLNPLSIYFPRGSSKSTTEFLSYLIALEKLKNIDNEAKKMKGE